MATSTATKELMNTRREGFSERGSKDGSSTKEATRRERKREDGRAKRRRRTREVNERFVFGATTTEYLAIVWSSKGSGKKDDILKRLSG